MKKNQLFRLLLLLFAITWFVPSFGQIKREGTPPSFATANRSVQAVRDVKTLAAPDVVSLKAEDEARAKYGLMPRISKVLPTNYTMENAGEWITLETGEQIWQLRVKSPGAIALSLYYDNFYLPEGAKLFIYSANKKHVVGAFTALDNPKFGPEFSTEMIAGDELILEYVAPGRKDKSKLAALDLKEKGAFTLSEEQLLTTATSKSLSKAASKTLARGGDRPVISISGIGYVYNNAIIGVAKEFDHPMQPGAEGSSGACMININCSEGGAWQNQKKGVAATVQLVNGNGWICSGTILNNTARDLTPYFLMAYHCGEADGELATAAELNQWQFYFHFERTGCENTSPSAAYRTAVGAQRLVTTNIDGGADGLLLRLNNDIPFDWDIYFNGWNRTNTPLTSGAGIHHPSGDVKKISFATSAATGATWNSSNATGASGAHWRVTWGTVNGKRGVTEGGSSGSPLFDQNGLVVGSLSGGDGTTADPCNTNTYSLYGKLWWHWDQSPDPDQHMSKYLDPIGTGATTLEGMYNAEVAAANFIASDTNIYVTQSITYNDVSALAATWEWTFEGGTPSSFVGRIPPAVVYNTIGVFTTTLTINKGTASELSATKTITVTQKDKIVQEVIGTGTASTHTAPLGTLANNYRYHRTAMLYHQEELAWMDGAGAITSLAWQKNAADPNPRNIKIWVKHYAATATNLGTTNTVAYNSALFNNAKLVVDIADFTNAVGYYEFPFNQGDKQFAYDPDSSLLILVETDYGANRATVNSTTPARIMNYHTKAYTENVAGSRVAQSVTSRPIVRITYKVTPVAPVADFEIPGAGGIFREKFDATAFPDGWTVTKPGASAQQWRPGSLSTSFTTIDPTNLYSAIIGYDASNNVESWLISPVIPVPASVAEPKVSFYQLWGGNWTPAGMVKFYISDDNGANWTEKWANTVETSMIWRQIVLDIPEYAGKDIQLAWKYEGLDLDNTAIDNVLVYDAKGVTVTVYEGETISFIDRSIGPPISWQWTLQGATPANSTIPNPTATYTKAGTYNVSLTVASDLGSHTKTVQGAVIVKLVPLKTPVWKSNSDGYTAYPHSGQFLPKTGGTVQFEDVSPVQPSSWTWTLTGATPASATGKTAAALYPASTAAATYSVKLKIANVEEDKEEEITDYVKIGGTSEIWNVEGGEIPMSRYTISTYFSATGADFFSQTSERFTASGPGVVSKVRVLVTNATLSSSSSMTVALYTDNNGMPGTLLSQVNIRGTNVTNNAYNTINFPNVGVPDAFHVVVGSSNYNTTYFTVPCVPNRANQHSTVRAYYGGWYDLGVLAGLYTSMNIIPEFTYTELELTSQDSIKKKNIDVAVETITFTTDAPVWTATADSWITLSETSGTNTLGTPTTVTLTFTVADNGAPTVREGSITINAGAQAKITVLQGGGAPSDLQAIYNDANKSVKLTWEDAKDPFDGIFDNIEAHTPYTINSPGPVGWTYIDGDGMDVDDFSIGLTGKIAFAVIDMDDLMSGDPLYAAHSGKNVLASLALPTSAVSSDDWLVSPELDFGSTVTFSFWARSLTTAFGQERMRVAYSTTGNAKGDFTNVLTTEPYVELSDVWVKFSYTIPANAKHVAINCVSNYAWFLLVDDLFIGTGTAPASAPANQAFSAEAGTAKKLTFTKPEKDAKEEIAAEPSAKTNVKLEQGAVYQAASLANVMQPQRLSPGQKGVLRWDNGRLYTSIGVASGGTIEVAAKFEPDDLADYEDGTIDAVDIAVANLGTSMVLKIWEDGTVIHSQPISGLTPGALNRIKLTAPIPLDVTKELMVSYIFVQAAGAYVPMCDNGPAVAGKGDLIALDGEEFEPLSELGLDYNWNIAVIVGNHAMMYNVYRNGQIIAEKVETKEYEDTNPPKAASVSYTVTAIYDGDPFFESTKSNEAVLYSKGHLTIAVDNVTRQEAGINPVFSARITEGDLLPGDVAADILALVKYKTAGNSLSSAGTYLIHPLFDDLTASTYADSYAFIPAPGVLTITAFPTNITLQPVGATICEGGQHTFSAAATGLDVKYQLQKQVNGVWTVIAEKTNNSGTVTSFEYTINPVTVTHAANYRIAVNGRSDKPATNVVVLRVGLPNLIAYPWGDVPTVNNNPSTNGGYSFVAFQWLRNNAVIADANKPYIQVPKGTTDNYSVDLTTNTNVPLASCPFVPQVSTTSLSVYPNPVTQGTRLNVQSSNLPAGSVANIYSSTGTLIKGNLPLFGTHNSIDISDLVHGLYVLQVSQPDGNKQTINIVVN
jgi:PKD repeat protein